MKKLTYIFCSVICFTILATGIFGCAEEFKEPGTLSGETITDVIVASTDFDILEAALLKTGLAGSYDNPNSGSYTFFAPSDAAFLAYLQSSAIYNSAISEQQAILNIQNLTPPLTSAILIQRLNNHIVSSVISTDDITTRNAFTSFNNTRLSLSNQGTVVLNANINSITAAGNGATITSTNDAPVNGIVHTIDRLLVPITVANVLTTVGITGVSYATNPATISPNLTTLEAAGDGTGTDFDILAYAIVKANLATVIQPNTTPLPDFTLFAPTDAAFLTYLAAASESDAIAQLKAMNVDNLANLLKYHIVSGRIVSTDLSDELVVTTLLTGKTFTVDINTGTYTLKDNRDTDASNDPTVTTLNTLTNAGVRHTVNTVLRSAP